MSGNHNAYQFKEGSMIKELTVRLRNPAYTGLGDIAADLIEAQAKEIEELKSAASSASRNIEILVSQRKELRSEVEMWKSHSSNMEDTALDITKSFSDNHKLLKAEIKEIRAALVECQGAIETLIRNDYGCTNAGEKALTRCKEIVK